MIKKLGLPMLVLGTALAVLNPGKAIAKNHDRDDERQEFREHRGRRHFSTHFYYVPTYRYRYGYRYYDPWYRSPYTSGYYDWWGYWHPYGY
jgi:hypothetical protein